MKVEKTKTQVLLNNTNNEYSFKLEQAEVFKLLTSKLYSNPLRTMLQEYITNARDIHRQTKQTKPIDIFFDDLNQIHIRDYGTGLNEEMIRNVFVYFGRSTKRTTNEQIGGFGIGAKSAFAYTDSFTIINRHNGTKEIYLATIKDEIPTLIEIKKEKTNEENGLEIVIPIKPNDISIAKRYVFDLVLFWYKGIFNPYDKVNVKFGAGQYKTIGEYYKNAIAVNTPEYAITKSYSFNDIITVEGIPYETPNSFPWMRSFVPHFKVGEIKIANNRENIVVENIDEIVNIIMKKLEKAVKNESIKDLTHLYIKATNPIKRNKYIVFTSTLDLLEKSNYQGSIRDIKIPGDSYTELRSLKLLFIYNNDISEFRGIIRKIQDLYGIRFIDAITRDIYNELIKVEPEITNLIKFVDINDVKRDNEKSKSMKNDLVAIYEINYNVKPIKTYIREETIPNLKIKLFDYELPAIIYATNRDEICDKIFNVPYRFRSKLKFITGNTKRIKKKYNLLTFDEFLKEYNEIIDKIFENHKKEFFKCYLKTKSYIEFNYDVDDKIEKFYNIHEEFITERFGDNERKIISLLNSDIVNHPYIYPSFVKSEIESIKNKTIKYLKDNFDIDLKITT